MKAVFKKFIFIVLVGLAGVLTAAAQDDPKKPPPPPPKPKPPVIEPAPKPTPKPNSDGPVVDGKLGLIRKSE